MKPALTAVLLFVACGASAAPNDASPGTADRGAQAFAWIKALAGQWEGTVEWSGARTDKGTMNATYQPAANGTAVIEILSTGPEPGMTSVYHMDGPDLRMTHYCAAGNQPRLRAATIDTAARSIAFAFVDVTNLSRPGAGHVHASGLRFEDPDHVTVEFTFVADGRESREVIRLARVRR